MGLVGKGKVSHREGRRTCPAIRRGWMSPALTLSPEKRSQPELPLPQQRKTTGALFGSSWQLTGREKESNFKNHPFPLLKAPSGARLEGIGLTRHGCRHSATGVPAPQNQFHSAHHIRVSRLGGGEHTLLTAVPES